MKAGFVSRIKLGLCRDRLTGRGGFLLLSELWEHLGLSGLLDSALPQPGSGRGFKPSEIVGSIVGLLLSGAEHLSDITHLSWDWLLFALNRFRKLPAPNTLTSWLNRCERWVDHDDGGGRENVALRGIRRVNRELLRVLSGLLKKTSLIVDVDATLVKTKKRTASITYKGFPGYQPQLAYLPELRAFLGSELRPGSEPSSKDVVSYLEDCRASMPDGTHIRLLRADAAYYQREVLKWCVDNDIDFAIRAVRDSEVMRAIWSIGPSQWQRYTDSDGIEQSDAEVASCFHSMDGVDWFRLVVLRRRRDTGEQLDLFDGKYECFPVATCLDCSAEDVIHLYNERGKVEDGIGQLKGDFGLSSMPCSAFEPNAVWIAIGILAFTIFALFKVALGGDWVVAKAKTVRFHILNIPGKLVRHARYVVLQLACSAEFLALFRDSRTRCRSLVSQFG
jgi:hypothetical protein